MRILLVEDDQLLAEALAEFLTDQLYTVDVVIDGEAAWEQIRTIEYIKSLRHKFRAVGAPDALIETVHGLGYRLKRLSQGSVN